MLKLIFFKIIGTYNYILDIIIWIKSINYIVKYK